jgi:hypothetical protein
MVEHKSKMAAQKMWNTNIWHISSTTWDRNINEMSWYIPWVMGNPCWSLLLSWRIHTTIFKPQMTKHGRKLGAVWLWCKRWSCQVIENSIINYQELYLKTMCNISIYWTINKYLGNNNLCNPTRFDKSHHGHNDIKLYPYTKIGILGMHVLTKNT